MRSLQKFFKKMVIKALIHMRGLTFYETQITPKSNCYRKLEIQTVYGHQVNFFFYEEELHDVHYRFGRFSHDKTRICLIQANFGDDMPPLVRKYNNLKIMIGKNDFFFNDEELLTEVLLSAYLDFILDKEKEAEVANSFNK